MTTATPAKYYIDCEAQCSLHPDRIGSERADALELIYQTTQHNTMEFARQASVLLGRTVSRSAANRHRDHYKELADENEAISDGSAVKDLVFLDAVIRKSFQNQKNWKPTLKDALDAMKLRVQITGGSSTDELMALFDGADDLDDEGLPIESQDAVLSEDERRTEDSEDLEAG